MGIVASAISAVLKSVLGGKLGSGLTRELIGISIDGISEKGIKDITNFINSGRSKIEHILSRENMESMNIPEDRIDYVIAEIKDLFSKISITDDVIRNCRYDSSKLKEFMWNKYAVYKNEYIEHERDIKKGLFSVSEVLIELISESEKLNADNQIILEFLQMILIQNQENSAKNKDKKQKVKSRTEEYAAKWNANMFLNNFDEWDENAGISVKLSDVYIEEHLPHFIWGNNKKESDNLKELLLKYVVEKNENKMLLILGQPGI
ncbi:MAG: hypothetical protein HFI67_05270 [Lachnospiraceae bacterium]|nr:hypothetical protein [Lachnospiraceae bacterium]